MSIAAVQLSDKFQPRRNNNKQHIITSVWLYYATTTEGTTDQAYSMYASNPPKSTLPAFQLHAYVLLIAW